MFRIKGIQYLVCMSLFMAGFVRPVASQEYILPLTGNRDLAGHPQLSARKAVGAVMLEVPVTDDFSYRTPYPSTDIWASDNVYINNGFAVNPPTIGVATLDALDENGAVYVNATLSPETFEADSLVSHPINLEYPVADSIYLSFFYQPQGNGIEPMPGDSLCLDFYNPSDSSWKKIWSVTGDSLRPFEQVMIPIRDTAFLKEGFRFKFRNRASLPQNPDYKDKRGNVDHWNIDYVRLDTSRNIADTVIRDVAFSQPLASMLKDYESIPWDHFEVGFNTFYRAYIRMTYYNNDTAIRNVTRDAEIYDEVWDESYDPGNATAQDIFPATSVTHDINSIYPFDFSRGDTASYLIKAWLRTDDFDYKENDTIYRRQIFRDYFAYDDGSAERAYGLRGQGSANGVIAVKFNSFIPDKLGGVDIYFSQLLDSLNLDYYFKFMVWDDNDGMPGNLVYEDDFDHTVEYTDLINKFRRFHFKEKVDVNGTFYIGLLQYNQYLLNIGLDINKPANGKLLYNIGNGWNVSEAPGSLMLRPYVSRSYSVESRPSPVCRELQLWPNPVSEILHISLPNDVDPSDVRLTIYDITGKTVMRRERVDPEIYLGDLQEGVYLVRLTSGIVQFRTGKIIIRR